MGAPLAPLNFSRQGHANEALQLLWTVAALLQIRGRLILHQVLLPLLPSDH